MTLDGGGGTSDAGESKPYFWGMRAITPDDTFGGVIKYIQAKMPSVKRIVSVGWDLGPASQLVINKLRAQLKAAGLQLVHAELTTVGATDFSTALSRVRAASPDILLLSIYGLDPGYFMKQYLTSGIGKPVIGGEFTPDAAKVSNGAYNQYTFAYDYFNAAQPTNDWAKVFADSFNQEYGTAQYEPDFYAANYYEDTFAVWDLIRRVLKKGGNPQSGTDLQQALMDNPQFVSVYGGSGSTLGNLALDPQTHTVTRRPMGLFAYNNGTITARAFFNLGGTDFQLV
jgi:branched-chain amino acid transport system substrate-binding protein